MAAYLAQRAAMPFAWGSNDCASFAIGAVQATCGKRVLKVTWKDALSASRTIQKLGGLTAAIDASLPRLKTAWLAQRGDVVLVTMQMDGIAERQWLAVVDSSGWIAPSKGGLVRGPIEPSMIAWGVGHA